MYFELFVKLYINCTVELDNMMVTARQQRSFDKNVAVPRRVFEYLLLNTYLCGLYEKIINWIISWQHFAKRIFALF